MSEYSTPAQFLQQELHKGLIELQLENGTYTPPPARQQYQSLDFADPVQLLYFCHPSLKSGNIQLYPWQIEELKRLALTPYSASEPLEELLIACNGSGKDSFIIAGFVVWAMVSKIRSRCIVTTKAFRQLQNQTIPSIVSICNSLNFELQQIGLLDPNESFVEIYAGHVKCAATGSEIIMFVTDDPARAEGYHPFPDAPNSFMALICNEAKSIDRTIYGALKRCTGYSLWLHVSSTGLATGYFYDRYKDSVMYPAPYDKDKIYCRKVTALDCPGHYSLSFLEKERKSMDPDLYNSVYMSEFISLGDSVVIPEKILNSAKDITPIDPTYTYGGGLDLSLGGDECVLFLRLGPTLLGPWVWKLKNNIVLETHILQVLIEQCSARYQWLIQTDVGGLGLPIFNNLRAKAPEHITFAAVNCGSPPIRHKAQYASTITADYFHIKTLLARGFIAAPKDIKTLAQLSRREFTVSESGRNAGKYTLVPKEELRADGEESPDRADAYVFCYRRYKFNEKIDKPDEPIKKGLTNEEIINQWEEWSEAVIKAQDESRKNITQGNSITDLMKYANGL